jgi:hypothetical protein
MQLQPCDLTVVPQFKLRHYRLDRNLVIALFLVQLPHVGELPALLKAVNLGECAQVFRILVTKVWNCNSNLFWLMLVVPQPRAD